MKTQNNIYEISDLLCLTETLDRCYAAVSATFSQPQVPYSHRLLLPLLTREFTIERAWFNEEIVNDFFKTLIKFSPKIAVISSQTTRRVNFDLAKTQLIFWPLLVNSHWHLIIIDQSYAAKQDISIYMLDSYNLFQNDDSFDIYRQYAYPLVKQLLPGVLDEQLIAEHIQIPSQLNDYDCGPAICYWAKIFAQHYCSHGQTPTTEELKHYMMDYTKFRKEIAKTIIAQKALN
ncbi:hypothetical protein CC99x_002365 [Candidatus Berkiella cookevillensis]|uniref:Ubiquitin-like protease family profile domain-containing protein n=1 Tax=Candidatus Berkiella cookevillensis TaxID=437022 RepID=A0A0Q9YBX9_9GAMM|nr:Ulp1 family isopeptidase [Candidatus Berkiella cookevillensis]MCS5707743.1 hypothetical protein [Candidatus Berkiella cookevillensis]